MMTVDRNGASDEQFAAIAYDGGNAYVGAGPGTGKTFLLVERCRHLRARGIPGSKILVLTFSRRAVLELRERLVAAGFLPSEIEVRTFHGFAARTIGGGTPNFRTGRLLDGFSRHVLLEAAIAQTPTHAIGDAARASRGFASELARVLDDLGRAPGAMRDPRTREASPRMRDVFAIANRAASSLTQLGATDIGDLVARAVADAARPGSPAARFLDGAYAHVLVDEFQDTDRMQLALLEALGATIFAVGDEAQSIYRFRGASNDIVTEALARFAMRRFDLTISRRCPPDVCALASAAPIAGLRALHSARATGSPVAVVRLRAVDDEVAYLANAIEAALGEGVPPSKIAVLVRAFRPLGPLLAGELRRRAIAVVSTGREEMLGDPRVAALRAALEVLDRPHDVANWQRLLTARPFRFDPIGLRFAKDELRALRLDAALPQLLERIGLDGAVSAVDFAAALHHAHEAWLADDLGLAARRLVRGLHLVGAVVHDEAPADVRRASARLKLVCDALANAQRTARTLDAPATPHDLIANFEEVLPDLALDDAGVDADATGVRVLTIHASKGLQFERVFVADAVAGRFPQDERRSTLLTDADRALLGDLGVDGPSVVTDATLREEASLWYVALTRCSDRLTISFADYAIDGGAQRPSRFIPSERLPHAVTVVDRESLYVKSLRHGDAAARSEVVASGVIANIPAILDFANAGENAFAPISGSPLRLERALGVGDAELWLQCPRRLFYKRFARLPDDGDRTKLDLGSAIHAVLERFHDTYRVFPKGAVDVATWTRKLLELRASLWDAEPYESPIVASAAAMAADVALSSYARALGARVEALGFTVELREEQVAVDVAGAHLAGRIDRVDRLENGKRVVIDYKTGSAKKETVGKAAEKIIKEWEAADAASLPRQPLARRAPETLKVQLPFYATALDDVASVAYVFLGGVNDTPKRNGAVFEEIPFDGALREVTTAALAEIETNFLAKLADGTLDHLPVTFDEDACTYCPYTAVCPGAAVLEDGS